MGQVHQRRNTLAMVGALLVGTTTFVALAAEGFDVGPQVRVDTDGTVFASNETSAAASDVNPNEIVATWNDWRESGASEIIRMGVAVSLDGGESWTDSLVRPPVANQTTVEGDPMTAFDSRTGTLWVAAISFAFNGGVYVARKDPGATTFQPSVMARLSSFADKCWMAAGPRPGMPDTTRLYIAFNEGVIWSDDMGDTWTPPVSVGGGIGFLPRVGPAGELYVAYWDFNFGMLMKRSLDGGQNFTDHTIATRMDTWGTQSGSRFPGTFRAPPLVYIDVDQRTGDLYAVYFDTTSVESNGSNVDLYFTTSTDQGTSWTTPVVINEDAPTPGDQFFPWLEVDQAGRIHIVFFDSRNVVQNDGVNDGFFDAYYMCSLDGGASWSEARLTPASWNSDDDGLDRPSQFIGDYLGMAVAGNRVTPIYLDTSGGDTDVYTNVITFGNSADVNGDGIVDVQDLLELLAEWGVCPVPDDCPTDINGDGMTGVDDLLMLLAAWGTSG